MALKQGVHLPEKFSVVLKKIVLQLLGAFDLKIWHGIALFSEGAVRTGIRPG
jgi:hypothetical protein